MFPFNFGGAPASFFPYQEIIKHMRTLNIMIRDCRDPEAAGLVNPLAAWAIHNANIARVKLCGIKVFSD